MVEHELTKLQQALDAALYRFRDALEKRFDFSPSVVKPPDKAPDMPAGTDGNEINSTKPVLLPLTPPTLAPPLKIPDSVEPIKANKAQIKHKLLHNLQRILATIKNWLMRWNPPRG